MPARLSDAGFVGANSRAASVLNGAGTNQVQTIAAERKLAINESVTFAMCVESGKIESQIVSTVESIRTYGGRLSSSPVLVITPRFGPSITRHTRDRLIEMDVKHLYRPMHSRFSWYVYMNKAIGARIAEECATTDTIAWLDTDVLVADEPNELVLGAGTDFKCCSVDKNIGTCGPSDPFHPYWRSIGEAIGVSVSSLPAITTSVGEDGVRFRLHSGVYSFRRGSGLGRAFVSDMERMLSSGYIFSRSLPFPGDDVALAFSVVRLGLRWSLLSMSHNYEMTPESGIYHSDEAAKARIYHYHHALSRRSDTQWFLEELWRFRPEFAAWLSSRVPQDAGIGGPFRRVLRGSLQRLRTWKRNTVARGAEACVADS